jgi:uncharacterized repeat protein (TIGR04076 family)
MAGKEIPESMLEMTGYTEEEVKGMTEKQKELLCVGEDLYNYKMIAEVVKASNCGYKPKIGDRYVFAPGGTIITEECTWPICVWALAPMLPFFYMYYDRIRAGLDPNDCYMENIKCADIGVDCGGFGEIVLKISYKKIDEEEKMAVLQSLMPK